MARVNMTPILRRSLSSTSGLRALNFTRQMPPRLPEKEQREFEELQRASRGAFSSPQPVANSSQQPSSKPLDGQHPPAQTGEGSTSEQLDARLKAIGEGDELHPDARRGAPPEFEGDRNPKTGEIGGPKSEPLRWGGNADWSYNGRVTDF